MVLELKFNFVLLFLCKAITSRRQSATGSLARLAKSARQSAVPGARVGLITFILKAESSSKDQLSKSVSDLRPSYLLTSCFYLYIIELKSAFFYPKYSLFSNLDASQAQRPTLPFGFEVLDRSGRP